MNVTSAKEERKTQARMTLTSLSKGKQQHPVRVLLYGPEGIGKSTFASNAPRAIFLGAEEGTSQLDVTRFPQPETWAEAREAVTVLTNEKHEFETLVVDTLDWLEPVLWDHMCRRDSQPGKKLEHIEDYGYGKGYQNALDDWRLLIADLERLRRAKPMHVVLLAHSWIKSFKNPTGDDYDRYELKIHPKASGLLKEWCDAVLFANYETFTHKDERKRIRGVDNGARMVHTQRTAAWDAKNRYALPAEMPLDWGSFFAAVAAAKPTDPKVLVEAITEMASKLGGQIEVDTKGALARVGEDAVKLSQLANWANALLNEKEKQS